MEQYMKAEKGRWQVTRWCCTSGFCIDCHNRGNHGSLERRRRYVHMDHLSKAYATWVAGRWQTYGGKAEQMPVRKIGG